MFDKYCEHVITGFENNVGNPKFGLFYLQNAFVRRGMMCRAGHLTAEPFSPEGKETAAVLNRNQIKIGFLVVWILLVLPGQLSPATIHHSIYRPY